MFLLDRKFLSSCLCTLKYKKNLKKTFLCFQPWMRHNVTTAEPTPQNLRSFRFAAAADGKRTPADGFNRRQLYDHRAIASVSFIHDVFLRRKVFSSVFSQSYLLLNSMIGSWHHNVVCLSVCDAVHCGSQSRCRRLKVAPSCLQQATSYLLHQTLLLYDVSFIHNTREEKRIAEISKSGIAMVSVIM